MRNKHLIIRLSETEINSIKAQADGNVSNWVRGKLLTAIKSKQLDSVLPNPKDTETHKP